MAKKTFLFLFIVVCFFLQSQAGFVPEKKAQSVAQYFFSGKIFLHPQYTVSGGKAEYVCTENFSGMPAYYVFNFSEGGFIIISASDRSYPVLGYSFEGSYRNDEKPANFAAWMQGYAQQIVFAEQQQLPADKKTSDAWTLWACNTMQSFPENEDAIEPLLSSSWDQGSHYNELCPSDPGGPSGHVYAGCVATAMAQVMYYWRYPLQGTGSHGYYSEYGYLSADFGNTTYQWENMTNSISQTGNVSMATLLYHCGIAVNMTYSPSGSGANSWDAVQALKTYFNYSDEVTLLDKENYTEEEWASLLKDNLDQLHPLYYNGYGSGGHAFNVDGYQGDAYFHFNWGWSGSYNGYFYLNNLNPGGQNFTEGQGAIVNIVPGDNYPYFCDNHVLNYHCGTIDDGSGPVNNYQASAACSWLLVPDDTVSSITLSFDKFATVQDMDVMKVYDGIDTTAPLLGIFSGTNLPPVLHSTGDKMFITFIVTSTTPMQGWTATYQAPIAEFCSGLQTLTGSSGIFSDGSGGYNYQNNSICQWKISPPGAQSITLDFNSFDIEQENDFLKIYNYTTQELIGEYSGNTIPETIHVATDKLFILFYTDELNTSTGWNAEYTSTTVGICETETGDGILLYPNPANTSFQVRLPEMQAVDVEMYAATGNCVYRDSFVDNTEIQIQTTGLPAGLYFVKISDDNHFFYKKLIIE